MAENFSNSFLVNTIYYLLNFEKYANFQDAVRQAAINNNFQIVLFSSDFNTIFSVETRHKTTIEDAVHARIEQGADSETVGARVDVNGVVTYWGPVSIGGNRYYMMLVDNDNTYSQDDIAKLAEIIQLAIGMWNYVPERDATAELIRAIRRGNRSLANALLEELGIAERELEGVFYIPGFKKADAIKLFSDFEEKYSLRLLKLFEQDEVAGVILNNPSQKTCEYDEWNELTRELYKMGVRNVFAIQHVTGTDGLCNGFHLINETLGFVNYIFPRKRLFSKFELAFVGNCVSIAFAGGATKRNYLDLVKAFRKSPDKKMRELEETLGVFMLDAGLSTARASRIMGVHSNTIQYRLKRIREILGVDITATTIVPGLMMAMAILRIEKDALNH